MDELTLVQAQAAQLMAAFEAGTIWTRQGPDDPCAVEEHEPIVPGLLPGSVFSVQELRGRPCVVVEFALEGGPPGLRWLHRFEPATSRRPESDLGLMWFQEGVECGWIARSLARVSAGTSPVWTDFSWGHPRGRWSEAMGLLEDGQLEQALVVLGDGHADEQDQELAAQIAALAATDDDASAAALRKRIWQAFWERSRRMREADRAATATFMGEHRLPDGSWSSSWSTLKRD